MNEKTSTQPKKGGVPTREILYAEAAAHAPRAIEVVVELLECQNENVRLGAAKTILAKAIPDITSNEISGPNGQQLTVHINRDYISPSGWTVSAPVGSIERSNAVQGSNMAQTSSQDLNSIGEGSNGSPQRPEPNILDSVPNQDSSQGSDLEGSEHVVSDNPPDSDRTPE